MTTAYPIVLVHGLMGFNKIFWFSSFYGIQEALEKEGHTVFVPTLSAMNSSEVRGEQLFEEIKRIRQETGQRKVHLIGHGQGALTSRYVASKYKNEMVASVTSVCGPNKGSEIADLLESLFASKGKVQDVVVSILNFLGGLITTLSGKFFYPQDFMAALKELTTAGAQDFNEKYNEGVPETADGSGPEKVDGINYYSWTGILDEKNHGGYWYDFIHRILVILSKFFTREKENDGFVGVNSSTLGARVPGWKVQSMDHLGAINQFAGITHSGADSIKMFTKHAETLRGLSNIF